MSGPERPLVTFALFAYRHEQFIAEAVEAALAQDYRPIEIIIADDASPDGTADEINRVLADYEGPIPVQLIRNPSNVGLIATLNHVMSLAKGDIVVLAAGDDVSLPTRTTETVRAFSEDDNIYSVYGNAVVIDAEGRELRMFYLAPPAPERNELHFVAREGFALLGASHAWRRRVFDVFGPLPEPMISEDHAIPFRSALLGSVRYVDSTFVRYRQHGNNAHLGTIPIAGSVAEWQQGLAKFLGHERAMLICRLSDLDAAALRFPERAAEIEQLRWETQKNIDDRTIQLRLLGGASLAQRVLEIARLAARGTPPRTVVRWILTFLVPRLYLRRLRRLAGAQKVG